MQFTKIDLHHVRIIESATLETSPGINLLYGRNGSGKTSVLEAIHLLSRGKSFRTPRIQELVQREKAKLMVVADIDTENQKQITTGISREKKQTKIKCQGENVTSISTQAIRLPVLVQTTESHILLTGTPKVRRKWLDWLLFHVEPSYIEIWKKYHSALRNRNKALRDNRQQQELSAWEEQMEKYGQSLSRLCQQAVENINQVFSQKLTSIMQSNGKLVYRQGWDSDECFMGLLEKSRKLDRDRGFTSLGPHRANVDFINEQELAVKNLSRGQSKLYLTALLLAQQKVINQETGVAPVLLFDDVAAELDSHSREKLLQELQLSGHQSFISTTESEGMESQVTAMFHVERGTVKNVKLSKNN